MPVYRMYFWLRDHGEIPCRDDFKVDDDAAASLVAHVLYNACSDVCDYFELAPNFCGTSIPSESQAR
jgi:hypothetical protein